MEGRKQWKEGSNGRKEAMEAKEGRKERRKEGGREGGREGPLVIVSYIPLLSSDDYEVAPGSCMSVHLEALRSGFAVLTVTYQYKEILLKASINIGAFWPLQVSSH